MGKINSTLQKIVYGSMFCIVLPIVLLFWARKTEYAIQLPVPNFPNLALVISVIGFLMISISMWNLWNKGKGLPMNAFPPKNYVRSGLYYFFHHPIYVGAVFMSFGLSMYFQSASGFWLISPLLVLLILAYVLGFENEIIAKAFPNQRHKAFFDFPPKNDEKSSWRNKLLIFIWVLLPWILLYETFIFLGIPKDAISTNLKIDDAIPFLDYSIIFYVLLYFLVILLPFSLKTNAQIRAFVFDSIVGMSLIFYCYLVFPFIVNYLPIENKNFFTSLIILGRENDGSTAALPSFHVFWALLSGRYLSKEFPKPKLLWTLISWLIVLSCLTTKNHSLLDVVFGIIMYCIAIYRKVIYQKLLHFCETISNSWKEWHFGNVRIINHGFYAALGGISGFLIIGCFFPDHSFLVYLIGISGFVGAGLWAQFVEGSPMLLRPFGYYGSVLGMGITLLFIGLFSDVNFWNLVAASTLAASSVQFFGRFRCLVQGCCHGKPTDSVLGIHFCHPKSRVNKISGWSGKNLYPTQFYSISSNFLTFFFLIRLVSLGMPSSFITGMYLILNGSFRFVEESLRGEPQTPYFMGMRVYQWLALLSIFLGIGFTCIKTTPLLLGTMNFSLILNSIIYGFLVLFAYGIDFPKSNKRFSRLTQ